MLTHKPIFERILKFLRSIDPAVDLHPNLPSFLWENMKPEPIPAVTQDWYCCDDMVKKLFYIVRGEVALYTLDEDGNKKVFRIYGENNVVMRNSFLHQLKSPCYIRVCKGAMLKSLSYQSFEKACQTMPGVKELAYKIAGYYERKELMRNDFICSDTRDCVLKFYKKYPNFLNNNILHEDDVASYLNTSRRNLSRIKNELICEGLLKRSWKR